MSHQLIPLQKRALTNDTPEEIALPVGQEVLGLVYLLGETLEAHVNWADKRLLIGVNP